MKWLLMFINLISFAVIFLGCLFYYSTICLLSHGERTISRLCAATNHLTDRAVPSNVKKKTPKLVYVSLCSFESNFLNPIKTDHITAPSFLINKQDKDGLWLIKPQNAVLRHHCHNQNIRIRKTHNLIDDSL